MNQAMSIATFALLTGLASLALGIVARSLRVALGCLVTSAMVVCGLWVAWMIWGWIA